MRRKRKVRTVQFRPKGQLKKVHNLTRGFPSHYVRRILSFFGELTQFLSDSTRRIRFFFDPGFIRKRENLRKLYD
ncbi:hypothetical protein LEP1GSC199_0218 [Leptospira vanthielii serovar Holland str. Waz Holland = ATCC 700522]|uniref:Uncharacterized protein n=1 Tax=Leptospira vanthielii serovar Holland str. Waz Holland = ATCC 700522 TaxID=1218591 RepID=N1WCC9_9LEPT|nr:hypothetical protein LEP1GSC199_0218 [Leptospira vanthielii serovar Holland str. Waz Holland = ATCC 700522]